MAKKNSRNSRGGLFDFNGDGKTDLGEMWLAFKVFEECTKAAEEDDEFLFEPDPFEWRFYCRDGKTYNIDPYDYETEESYNKALKNAERRLIEEQKYSWRETCVYNDYGIDAENYESEAEYEAAIEERRNAWADYLSDEIREKAEKHLLKPEYFSDEEDFFQHLQEIEEAQNRPIFRTKPSNTKNIVLEQSICINEKEQVLSALIKGFASAAKLTVAMHISMDTQDGADTKCVYVLERTTYRMGEWVIAYTSPNAAKKDEKSSLITGNQEMLLRSIVKLPDIDGVLFRSEFHSFCLTIQDITDLLATVELRREAWDAICTHRTIAT